MNARTTEIKQLVRESQYVVDPRAVADAMVVRSMARRLLSVPRAARRARSAAPGRSRR